MDLCGVLFLGYIQEYTYCTPNRATKFRRNCEIPQKRWDTCHNEQRIVRLAHVFFRAIIKALCHTLMAFILSMLQKKVLYFATEGISHLNEWDTLTRSTFSCYLHPHILFKKPIWSALDPEVQLKSPRVGVSNSVCISCAICSLTVASMLLMHLSVTVTSSL